MRLQRFHNPGSWHRTAIVAAVLASAAGTAAEAKPAATAAATPAAATAEVAPATGAAAAAKAEKAPAAAAGKAPEAKAPAAKPKPMISNAPPPPANPGYYVEPGSYGTRRETVPPQYTRRLSQIGVESLKDIDWVDVGLDYRMRYEMRHNDLRRPDDGFDNPFLLRTRAYLGVRDKLDPLRFAIEVEDARVENSKYANDDRGTNELEPIQMIAELHFKNLLPRDDRFANRPVSLRGGRMWFEKLDRRLLANNEWRNTTNTFQGIHLDIGRDANDWEVEFIAAQPLERKKYDFDRINDGQWFYALIGHIRRWSDIVTIEPYYLALSQDKVGTRKERRIHAPALRFYGPIGNTPAHYDVDLMYQAGEDDNRKHSAFGAVSELGWRFQHPWAPRASVQYGYASGDEKPTDDSNQRFDRFFGFARPWSASDYVAWENLHSAKTRFEIQPLTSVRADWGYSAYWLASDTDSWKGANLRDTTGKSGDFMGHEFDIRARWTVNTQAEAVVGYAHFEPGEFTKNRGRDNASDFVYFELRLNAFPKI